MATTWQFAFRLPALLFCLASIALGAAGALDWAPASSLALIFGFVAYLAGLMGRRAAAHHEEHGATPLPLAPNVSVLPGLKGQRSGLDRAA
ncbi:MAG: hypothetical protein M0R74_03255 [Dehalococcoidia bacterium]|nr:hypothetical protein [Dehalococcoidia bacterium]